MSIARQEHLPKGKSAHAYISKLEIALGGNRSIVLSEIVKNTSLESVVKTAGQDSFRGSGSTICDERMQEGQTEKEEMRQQHTMKTKVDVTRKITAKDRMEANYS